MLDEGTTRYARDVRYHVHRPAGDASGVLLVALHGQGMSARSFARELLPAVPEGTTVLLPDGPQPFEIRRESGLRRGHAWYVYTGDENAFVSEMQHTGTWLIDLVDDVVAAYELDPRRVDLLGFSQGGYMAGYLGISHAERFRKLVVAGARIKHEVLEEHAHRAVEAGAVPELLCVHGDADPSVRVDAVRASFDALGAWGVRGDFRTFPCGHTVLREAACAAAVGAFLAD